MPPKKKVEQEEVVPEVVEEPHEPEIVTKCFRTKDQLYSGECMVNSDGSYVRSGQGKQVFTTKDVLGNDVVIGSYSGAWAHDIMEGEGIFRWLDGSFYDGSFYNGLPHGFRGRYEWPDGSSYEGSWVNGQMNGQGRYDSRTEGSFLSGKFYRNYYVRDSRLQSICDLQAKAECKAIAHGDASAVPVYRRAPGDSQGLSELLTAIYDEGCVPLVLSDASVQDPTFACLAAAVSTSCVNVAEAAVVRHNKADFGSIFYGAIQAALLENTWFSLMLDDQGLDVSEPLPDAWRIAHYVDAGVLPLEVFQPKLFNGRSGFLSFLTPELYDSFKARMCSALVPQPGLPPTAYGGDCEEECEETILPEPNVPGIFHLRTMLAASAKLPAGLGDEALRAAVLQKYAAHAPLHRTRVVLLSLETPEAY